MSDLTTSRRIFVFAALIFAVVTSVFPRVQADLGFTSFSQHPQTSKQHETELGATVQEAPLEVSRKIQRQRHLRARGFSMLEPARTQKHSRPTALPSERKGGKGLKLMKEELMSEKASNRKLRADMSSMQVKQAQLRKQLQRRVKVEKELRSQVAQAEERAEQAAAMVKQLQQSATEAQAKAFRLELQSLTSESQLRAQTLQEVGSLRERLNGASVLLAEVREQRETASNQVQRLEADLMASQQEARTLTQCLKDLASILGVGGFGGFLMRWMTHKQIASEAQQRIRELQKRLAANTR